MAVRGWRWRGRIWAAGFLDRLCRRGGRHDSLNRGGHVGTRCFRNVGPCLYLAVILEAARTDQPAGQCRYKARNSEARILDENRRHEATSAMLETIRSTVMRSAEHLDKRFYPIPGGRRP